MIKRSTQICDMIWKKSAEYYDVEDDNAQRAESHGDWGTHEMKVSPVQIPSHWVQRTDDYITVELFRVA